MRTNDDILKLLSEKRAQATWRMQRAVVLQPGAIGDCILTLPLVKFMKDSVGLGGVDIIGHSEYIGFFPGRTSVDGIISIDSMDLHRLFAETKAFNLADRDPLINAFEGYSWIVSFLGEPNSNFEQNLIFTANCSHSVEVITLSMKPPEGFSSHLAEFYTQQFIDQSGLSIEPRQVQPSGCSIKTTKADVNRGRELLRENGVDTGKKVVVIAPGSGGLRKRWHLDNFLAVAKALSCRDVEVIFLLGPAELEQFSDASIEKISSVARCLTDLPLARVLELLSCCDGFVGNDSGITHLAAGLGVKTVAVFGPTNPAVYKPVGPYVTVFTSSTADFAAEPSEDLQQEVLNALTA